MTTILLLGVLAAAIALAAFGLAAAWRRVMRDRAPLPLYAMLTQHGLSADEVGDALGVEALAFAVRRCAFCGSGEQCRQRLAAGAPAPADCPNAELFGGLTRPRA